MTAVFLVDYPVLLFLSDSGADEIGGGLALFLLLETYYAFLRTRYPLTYF